MDDFVEMNSVYEKRQWACSAGKFDDNIHTVLPTPKPARTCIQAAKLPLGVDVEIEAIAAA